MTLNNNQRLASTTLSHPLTQITRTSLMALCLAVGIAVGGITLSTSAQAKITDPQLASALKKRDFKTAEAITSAALKANPQDVQGLLGRTRLALMTNDSSQLDGAIKDMQTCLSVQETNADCQYYSGVVNGLKAAQRGITAIASINRAKAGFERSVELEPDNIRNRIGLTQLHLLLPGMMGGSETKARAQVAELSKLNKARGEILAAMIDLHDKKDEQAEKRLLSLATQTDEETANAHVDMIYNVGGRYVRDKKYDAAKRVFEALSARYPQEEQGPFGLGRVAQEQGNGDAALELYARALKLMPQQPGVYYRMGQIYAEKGDKAKAIENLNRALNMKPSLSTRVKEDAQKLLAQLKG